MQRVVLKVKWINVWTELSAWFLNSSHCGEINLIQMPSSIFSFSLTSHTPNPTLADLVASAPEVSSYPPADFHLAQHLLQVSLPHLSPCCLPCPLHTTASDLSGHKCNYVVPLLKPFTSLSSHIGQSMPSQALSGLTPALSWPCAILVYSHHILALWAALSHPVPLSVASATWISCHTCSAHWFPAHLVRGSVLLPGTCAYLLESLKCKACTLISIVSQLHRTSSFGSFLYVHFPHETMRSFTPETTACSHTAS